MYYDVETYREVYDKTYSEIKNYNFHNLVKDIYVDIYAAYVDGKILDAGCGEGIHLKRMLKNGHDAFGIELSSVCCEKYLADVPHENIDILNFAKKGKYFDGLICMDVLEHIPYENIDDIIISLSRMAKSAFFGIANHSDVLNGVELHLIQQDSSWWIEILKKYYKKVYFIGDQFEGKFYYIYCTNQENENKFYIEVNSILKTCVEIDSDRMHLLNIYNEKKIEITQLNTKIIQQDNTIRLMYQELESIKHSRGYRLLVKYRIWRDKIKELFI